MVQFKNCTKITELSATKKEGGLKVIPAGLQTGMADDTHKDHRRFVYLSPDGIYAWRNDAQVYIPLSVLSDLFEAVEPKMAPPEQPPTVSPITT